MLHRGSVAVSSHQCTLLRAPLASHREDTPKPAQSRQGSLHCCIGLQAVVGHVDEWQGNML